MPPLPFSPCKVKSLTVRPRTSRFVVHGIITATLASFYINSLQAQSDYSSPLVISTLAGSGAQGSVNGTGIAASFKSPQGVALDAGGNIYVADSGNNKIRKISPIGEVSTFAGSGSNGSADGVGAAASFAGPVGVSVDTGGNVFVADFGNHKIRKISPIGEVSTLAGGGWNGSTDGTGSAAFFYSPAGVAVDASGNVFVADHGNHKIRKISPAGVVTTLAGSGQSGSADGMGAAAKFHYPRGVALDAGGNVYVGDSGNSKIRKISPAGAVTTLAGSGAWFPPVDGTGAAATFNAPQGVAVDGSGNVFVADPGNHNIRKISPAGVVTTLAGAEQSGSADGTGAAATFNTPIGVAVDGSGNVFVADASNHKIRKGVPALAQYITFPVLSNKTYGDDPFTVSATASSGLAVTFSIISGPAAITGNTVTLTGAGTVTVRASQAGNAAYASATNVDRTFTVQKGSQTITFPAIANRLVGTASIALSATTSSGLPVSYSIFSGPASLVGSTLTLSAAGTVFLRASQPGNSNYLAAPSVDRTFTVAPNTAGPSFIAISKTWFYDNAALNTVVGTLSAADPDAGDVITYTKVSGTGATDNAKFSLTGGVLRTASTAFNYETGRTASVRVRATDSAGQFTEQVIILNIMSATPNVRFIPAGLPFTQAPNYVNAVFMLVNKSTGRGIMYPRSLFDPGSADYQPDLFQAFEGTTLSTPASPIAYNESYFQVGKISDVPSKVRTVILLDCSSSISIADLALIKTAAKVMVDNMFSEQEIAVYSFSGTWTKLQDFLGKSDANQTTLKAAIDTLTRGSATTNLYGSMLEMLSLPKWKESFTVGGIETGFLVVLTDGADTSGAATKEQVIAKRDDVVNQGREMRRIYTIGLGVAIEPLVLQELQNTSFYKPVSQAADLAAAFADIQQDILDLANSFYRFNYVSPKRASNPTGTFRKLEVQLKNNTNPAADRLLSTKFISDSFQDLAPAMYINRTVRDLFGVASLAISKDLPSMAYGITLFPPLDSSSFVWAIGNPAVATLTPQGATGERVIISPNGQNGTTTLTLTDTISNFTKTIPLIIGTGAAPAPQTIVFASLPDLFPSSPAFTLAATASSTLPVSFAVLSGPATLSGNTVTLTGASGTVSIRATQPGNVTYAAATPVNRSFTVAKGTQSISFGTLAGRPAASAPFALGATALSGLTVSYTVVLGPATIHGNTVTLTGATGTVTVEATQTGNADWEPATPVQQSFEATSAPVVPVAQIINFPPPPSRFLSESPVTLAATATSGLAVVFEVVSGPATLSNGNVLALTGIGTVNVRASQPGNAGFLAATEIAKSFKVAAAPTSLMLINLAQTYTGTPRPIATLGGTGEVTITYTINKQPSAIAPINPGSYPVKVVADNGTKSGTLVIAKAPLTINPDNQRRFINQANPPLTFSYSGFLGADNADNSLTKLPLISTAATIKSAGGNYPIKATGAASANYTPIYVNGVLTVETFAGRYEALLARLDNQRAGAKIELTVAASSTALTGKLTVPGEVAPLPLKGVVAVDALAEKATGTITAIKGANTYVLTVDIPLMGDFTAALSVNSAAFANAADGRRLFTPAKGQKILFDGTHTMVMAPALSLAPTANPLPAGSGHATANIDAEAVLAIAGRLADGTTLTASLQPDDKAGYRMFAQPYKRANSYLAGWIEFEDHPDLPDRFIINGDAGINLAWAKAPSAKDKSYRQGFDILETAVTVDPWRKPVGASETAPALTLAQLLRLNTSAGQFDVSHSSIASATFATLSTDLQLDLVKNTVAVTAPLPNNSNWQVKFNTTNGTFTGSFVLNDAKLRTVPFTGVLRQPPSTDSAGSIGAGHSLVPALPTDPTNEILSSAIQFARP